MFEEYRIKRLLKKDITVEMYQNLPIKIKNDPRIIEKFISIDKNNINFISGNMIIEIVKNDYSFCQFLNQKLINSIFSKLDISKINIDGKMFSLLTTINKHQVLKNDPKLYFNLISNEELNHEFDRMIRYMNDKKDGYSYDSDAITDPVIIKDVLLSLSPERIELVAKNGTPNSKRFVNEVISSLPAEEQMNLYNSNNELFEYLATDIQEEIEISKCEGNIDKIVELSEGARIKYFSRHIEQLKHVSDKIAKEVLQNSKVPLSADLLREITYDKKWRLGYYFKITNGSLSKEELLKLLKGGGKNLKEYMYGFFHQPEIVRNLREIIKLNLLEVGGEKKKEELLAVFDSTIKIEKDLAWDQVGIKLASMFLDEKIIQNNSPELLKKYSETNDRGVFIEILSNAYGEHVKEIFESRPMLDYHEIPNFKIFEKSIADELGVTFINYVLTYDYSRFSYELSLIATDSTKMETFKKIWKHTISRTEKVDAGTVYEIMDNFCKHEDLIAKLDFANMTEEQKKNFDLFLKDVNNVDVAVTSVNDLDNYLRIRNDAFSKNIEKLSDSTEMKNLIFGFLTGREVNPDIATIDTMGVDNVVEVFNVNNIIRNPKLIEAIGLNNDEVALLLLINQIKSINNEQVLRDVFLAVSNSKELNPLQFKSTFDKISEYYVDKFKGELTDSKALDQMPHTIVDGIPVVTFDGDPFNVLCSITGLDLTLGLYSGSKNKDDLLTSWLNLENGMSTISCALCSSDINVNPAGIDQIIPNITFVFDSDVEVIGMGGSDISSSHTKRQAHHSFEYIGHNKMKYGSMEEVKKDMSDSIKDMNSTGLQKFPSEISIQRRNEDIKDEQVLKRRMPIGIYVLGELTEEHLKVAKMFKEYYKKENLGEFRIIKVNPEKYKSASIFDYVRSTQEPVQSNVTWYQDAQEPIDRGK